MIFASGVIVERTLVTRPRLSTHRCACMLHNQNLIPFLVPPPSCLSVFFEVVVVVVANFLEDVTAMTRCNRQALITTIDNIIVCARDAMCVKQMHVVGLRVRV